MTRYVFLGAFLGAFFGGMVGTAVAGGWGGGVGAFVGLCVGALALGSLSLAARGWAGGPSNTVHVICPEKHIDVTLRVKRDPTTDKAIQVVGCTAFADPSGVTCNAACLASMGEREG